jgi:conjugal transfer pilus assembly protein TraV
MGTKTGIVSLLQSINFKYVGLVFTAVLLNSCASSLSVGGSEFGCAGLPEGVRCMSAKDVYMLTNDGQVPRAMDESGRVTVTEEAIQHQSGQHTQPATQVLMQQAQRQVPLAVETYVAPRLPDDPIPVRTPAEVMRIWVAPWEDTNGDLIVTGYVFTEIEPRRWVIGEKAPGGVQYIQPLQRGR